MRVVEGAGQSPAKELIAEREASKLAFDRIVYFSDAVFAIAMTVLVLDLVREYEQRSAVGLADCGEYCHIREVGGLICGYSVTFGVLGMIWAAHHQIFRAVGRTQLQAYRL